MWETWAVLEHGTLKINSSGLPRAKIKRTTVLYYTGRGSGRWRDGSRAALQVMLRSLALKEGSGSGAEKGVTGNI